MYDFVRGPLVWVAFLVFIFGTAYQLYRFYRLSRPKERFRLRIPFGKPPKDPGEAPAEPELTWWQQAQLSVAGRNPVMITVTTLFHLALVLTPLFVLGHNVLFDLAWQVSLPSLPEAVADGFTVVVIAGGLFFLLRRIFLARVRSISTTYDYLVLLAATAPFVTGFFAYHHIFDYDTVVLLHMLSGEIMLMAVPFTKLVHMPFFFINRFVLVHENTMGGGGSRVWR
jgi:nitrate reductase gamma subunit